MAVERFDQPDYTTQGGSAYPTTIDRAIAVLEKVGGAFAVSAIDPPTYLMVEVRGGRLRVGGEVKEISSDFVGIGAVPSGAGARRDIVVIDRSTGLMSVIEGVASATPADPPVPDGKIPLARVRISETDAAVDNSMIDDLRSFGDGAGGGQAAASDFLALHFLTRWDEVVAPVGVWESVAWSPELEMFMAVGSGPVAGRSAMFSSDGITWANSINTPADGWAGICWDSTNQQFVAVRGSDGSTPSVMTYSAPDYYWAAGPGINAILNAVAHSPELGRLVAVGASGATYSDDGGATWSAVTALPNNQFEDVCWAPELGLFVACSYTTTATAIATSPDGITWTGRDLPAAGTGFVSISWSPELRQLCAVAYGGTNRVAISDNGISWQLVDPGHPSEWHDVIWCPELRSWVAVGRPAGTTQVPVMTSPDGTTWTAQDAPRSGWESVAWSPQLGRLAGVDRDPKGKALRGGRLIDSIADLGLRVATGRLTALRRLVAAYRPGDSDPAAAGYIASMDYSGDGRYLYLMLGAGVGTKTLVQIALERPWQLTSAAKVIATSTSALWTSTSRIAIDPLGRHLYALVGTEVRQLNMTGGDITTIGNPNLSFVVGSQTPAPTVLRVAKYSTTAGRFVVGSQADGLYTYDFTIGDITTASLASTGSVPSSFANLTDIDFSASDGRACYLDVGKILALRVLGSPLWAGNLGGNVIDALDISAIVTDLATAAALAVSSDGAHILLAAGTAGDVIIPLRADTITTA